MRMLASLQDAVRVLKKGGVVALPTDTVMGLVGLPRPEVVDRIFDLKGRPRGKPLVLFTTRGRLPGLLSRPCPCAQKLSEAFWPGPLSLVIPAEGYPEGLQHRRTLGVRHPGAPFPQALLETFPEGLASTSANPSGAPPALKPGDLPPDFAARLDGVLSGHAPGGVPSTLVDCASSPPRLLRAGPVGIFALEAVLGEELAWGVGRPLRVLLVCTGNTCRSPLAHGIMVAWVREKGLPVEVDSAGTLALEGAPVAREVITVLRERGIAFSHISHRLTPGWIAWADLILTMTEDHLREVEALGGGGKVARLASFDMPDPIGQPVTQYRWVADLIEKALRERWFPYLERKFSS